MNGRVYHVSWQMFQPIACHIVIQLSYPVMEDTLLVYGRSGMYSILEIMSCFTYKAEKR
jgi:hypothetical protein